MKERAVLDVSRLPLHGMGSASVTWWGTLGFMLLEGTGFALVVAIYLYLYGLAPEWPLGAPLPDLGPGTWLTGILLASLVPNSLVNRWAGQEDLRKVRIGILIMTAFGIAPLVVRIYEFPALHVWWDANAYGSITWVMLGLHTTHLITDLADTLVLAAIMFSRHGRNKRRFGDVQDNALYWTFVVLTWLPLYACLYWVPRL
ncbi:cytochrome c oxidase subunit 3 [Methylobacterium sp. ID0610]|uniref:cytochrome c oxidase subunit 3 n=1 Tax=Methylobacterium carpenticola TaxID=3344827 RepID=UPI00368A772D